jgi:nucleoside-diphosphate-sugar epimerase
LAQIVARVTDFQGEINWDSSRPDGTPQKLLDTSRINSLGWKPSIPLEIGIRETYEWFKTQLVTHADLRL